MSAGQDIAIVGMACVFPKAPDLRQYWANLAGGVDAIGPLPADRWHETSNFALPKGHEVFLPTHRGGYLPSNLPFDPLPFGVLPNLVKYGDPDQFLMLHVIDRALKDARITDDAPVRQRTDVVIGRGGYATGKLVELTLRTELFDIFLESLDRKFPELMRDSRRQEFETYLRSTLTPLDQDNVSTAVSNITASRTANRLNLRGAAYTVDAACASSLLATEQAVMRLRSGHCDVAVAAGLFLSLTPTFMYVFHRLGALSPSGQIRPLDRRADGLLAGEGGGAVILKRLEDAQRDGDLIYAVIKGVGSASDGKEVDVLAPASGGQVLALERAYADADVPRDSVGYLEMHGTGTLVGDAAEIESIKRFFGTSGAPPTARAMGSVKSMIGHTMPAAGIASLIKTALSLSNKIIPPSLHCDEPRPELEDAPFFVNTQTRPWIHNTALGPRRAGVNAFGFGGINAHVVLEEAAQPAGKKSRRPIRPRPIESGSNRASELLAFAAATKEELHERIAEVLRFLENDQTSPTLADVALSLSLRLDLSQPVKLAVIVENLAAAQQRLAECLAKLGDGTLVTETSVTDDSAVYFAADAARHEGKLALVFPGMGFPGLIGNYPDHLMELCLHYPEVRSEFDFFENRDRHPDDTTPTSAVFSPPASLPEEFRAKLKSRLAPPKVDEDPGRPQEASERYLAAMGVTLSNWVGWRLIEKLGIPVDMVTGQSQGEMAAVCVAGMADFHETAPSFWKVLNVDPRNVDGHRLAFAWTSAEKVAPILADTPGTYLAIYMAPEGIIMGGAREGLLAVGEKLREEQILFQLLPYPAIHTPALSHLRDELLTTLGDTAYEMRPPKIDMYSSILADKYPADPQAVRETLMLNIDQPLRIWQTIRKMHEDGARIFVQVGGGHMAAHMERLLPEGSRVVTAALDIDTRNPLTQLNHLCAILLTRGVPINLGMLFEYRHPRRLDFTSPQPLPTPPRSAVPLRIDWSPLYSPNVPPKPASVAPSPDAAATRSAAATHVEAFPASQDVAAEPELSTAEPIVVAGLDPELLRRLPVVGNGQVVHFVPEEALAIERGMDLDNDLFLADHLFVYADKPVEDCLPILPLTFSLEFLAEAGALLSPGMGLIGFEEVRGLRWTGLRNCRRTDLRIEARVRSTDAETGVRRVEGKWIFEGKPSFTAVALFAPYYRQDVRMEMADDGGATPWPITLDQVYGERYMFHGPTFHVVSEMSAFGNPSARAKLRVLPKDRLLASCPDPILITDPYLMDGIGQVVGLWSMMHEQYILPATVDKIEIYGPTPPLGTDAPIRIEVLEFNAETKQIRCNIEIEDGQGNVWVRVVGWTEWILKWTTRYADATRLPGRYLMCEQLALAGLPRDAVCMKVTRKDFTGIDLDWAARIFLNEAELPQYWAIDDSKRRREMLLSRVAAKDAARLWSASRQGAAYRHPAEMTVEHDSRGAPGMASADGAAWPNISLSHAADAAVAIACDGPVGIDIEPAQRSTAEILPTFATADEQAIVEDLERTAPEENWATRLWCAKEAVAKLLKAGLEGRPKDYEAVDADADGAFVLRYEPTGARYGVHTVRHDGLIIAYTTAVENVLAAAEQSS